MGVSDSEEEIQDSIGWKNVKYQSSKEVQISKSKLFGIHYERHEQKASRYGVIANPALAG